MSKDKRHVQLRLTPDMHHEIGVLAKKYEISTAELIRGILYLGLPVFETMTDLRTRLVVRLVKTLKKEARKDKIV